MSRSSRTPLAIDGHDVARGGEPTRLELFGDLRDNIKATGGGGSVQRTRERIFDDVRGSGHLSGHPLIGDESTRTYLRFA